MKKKYFELYYYLEFVHSVSTHYKFKEKKSVDGEPVARPIFIRRGRRIQNKCLQNI